MHAAIDLTGLMPLATGVDVYMRQLVQGLAGMDRRNQYTVLTARGNRAPVPEELPGNFRLRPIRLGSRPTRAFFQQCVLPALARTERFEVVHSPAFLLPLLSSRPGHVLTVHDMTFFQMPEVHTRLRSSAPFLWAVRKSIHRADLVTVPSRATEAALLEHMPDLDAGRIRVVPHGIEERFRPEEPSASREVLDKFKLSFPYILFVGTLEPRKNLRLLLEAFRKLVAGHAAPEHLVLVGKRGWGTEELERDLRSPELQGRVHYLGYVGAEDLPHLYRGARLFVYPSLLEGFGFPPLEAMACGVPVIATDNSSLAENLRGAAELIAGNHAGELSAAIRTLLESPCRLEELRAKGLARATEFQWSRTAAIMLQVYEELARSTGPSSDFRRSR